LLVGVREKGRGGENAAAEGGASGKGVAEREKNAKIGVSVRAQQPRKDPMASILSKGKKKQVTTGSGRNSGRRVRIRSNEE